MSSFLLEILGLIVSTLHGETKQENMLLNNLASLMRVVSSHLEIKKIVSHIKIKRLLGYLEIQLQVQTSLFGKKLKLILEVVGLFQNVNIQG